jgi:hypothetical protein
MNTIEKTCLANYGTIPVQVCIVAAFQVAFCTIISMIDVCWNGMTNQTIADFKFVPRFSGMAVKALIILEYQPMVRIWKIRTMTNPAVFFY